MAKIHQQLQELFKFRILANSDISNYITRMSKMGKIDDVKRVGMFNIILTKLGELEDKQELFTNTPSERQSMPEPLSILEVEKSYKCDVCGRSCASDFGLKAHKRAHTNKK